MEGAEQSKVRVSFDYYPDEPDADDDTGMAEGEYLELIERIGELGGDNPTVEKIGPPPFDQESS
jgi:hypothetical protein